MESSVQDKIDEIERVRITNFRSRLKTLILQSPVAFTAEYHHAPEPIPLAETFTLKRKPIREGSVWGREWESGYFRLTAKVPREWRGRKIAAWLDLEGELLVYDRTAMPLIGLTNGSVFQADYIKAVYQMGIAKGGESIELFVEAAANSLFGITRHPELPRLHPDRHGKHTSHVNHCKLCLFDEEMWGLHLDLEILASLHDDQGSRTVRSARILKCMGRAVDRFQDDPRNARACRALLAPEIAKKATPSALTAHATGHAHIDTGWLWRVRESVRKCARTFSSQLGLIKRYPGYIFGASMAEHYQMMKTHHPALYRKIKEQIRLKRWEIQGAMWVEADCNLTSGESLVRQFVMAKNFFKSEFGVEVNHCWIPDVFGYSAAMPQIMKKSGVDFFLTQKLSWNKINRFPHHTFVWRGIDGSEVITHFPPESTYNSGLHAKACAEGERNFFEKDRLNDYMVVFGIGDGGGGPSEEYIERGLRLRDLEGSPKVRFGRVDDFFKKLATCRDQLDTWSGELYFEAHRGTLTTQARTKRNNRKLEIALRQTEALCSMLPLNRYPRKALHEAWHTLLLHQFHDILPGSSIHAVYADAEAAYAAAFTQLASIQTQAAKRVLKASDNTLTLFNCLSHDYAGPIELPRGWQGCHVQDEQDAPLAVQEEGPQSVALARIPAHGFITLAKGRRQGGKEIAPRPSRLVLENALIRYGFDRNGRLTSAFDKEAGFEVIEPGKAGNLLALYGDRPHNWDAWDIDHFYPAEFVAHAEGRAEPLCAGPVRQGLRFHLEVASSRITQEVFLAADSKRLDFRTTVDWKESHRMLRVSFPVAVHTAQASFDIQYGTMKRATHSNSSWEWAQFEVCGHQFADLSDDRYGVALLNDCKYGYRVKENVLDLNLLRSPSDPDPDADYGPQRFTYSLLPHTGTLNESSVRQEAASLNTPPLRLPGLAAKESRTLPVSVTGAGLSLEVIKKAEQEECLVVRVVETRGCHSSGTIQSNRGPIRLVETLLTEWTHGKTTRVHDSLAITLSPFEIRTYKVTPA